jgi:putative membrane protein
MLNKSMKTLAGILSVAVLVGTAFAPSTLAQDNGRVNSVDVFFANEASLQLVSQIALSQLAQQFAERAETRQLARRIVADNTEALNELVRAARERAIALPNVIDFSNINPGGNTLPAQIGDRQSFDAVYLRSQIQSNERLQELFENEAANNGDPALRSMAERQLTNIDEHLRLARQVLRLADGSQQ